MLQIPEGLQMGSIQAASVHATPAGVEFILMSLYYPYITPTGLMTSIHCGSANIVI